MTKVFKHYINGVAWKGYGFSPTNQQISIDLSGYRRENGLGNGDSLTSEVKEEFVLDTVRI